MSDDGTIAPVLDEEPGARDGQRTAEIAEHERQFREILEHCPAGLNVVDEDGRLLFHNARLRKLMGYDEEEMHLFDTKRFWHDLDQRARIIETLRERGGQLLERGGDLEDASRAGWSTVLMSYVQVAYRGGHVSFVGGKRSLGLRHHGPREREAQIAEQERQFREHPRALPRRPQRRRRGGRLVFHNARLRELLGYDKEELHLFDTRRFWHDLDHRARIIETCGQQGGQLLNEEVIWKTKQGRPVHVLDLVCPGGLPGRP